WNGPQQRLRQKLRSVQLDQLRLFADGRDWVKAFDLSSRLAKAYTDRETQDDLARQLSRLVEQSLEESNYTETRMRLKVVEELFPNSNAAAPFNEKLRSKAAELFQKSKDRKNNDRAGAMEMLATAEAIWPRLPGLRDFRLQLEDKYPTLRVGVGALPE